MKKIKDFFVFYKNGPTYVQGFPFTDRGFEGTKQSIYTKISKQLPQLAFQTQPLILADVAFLYDPVNMMIRIIPVKDIDINTVSVYINEYIKNFMPDELVMNDVCKKLNMSNFRLSSIKEKALVQIANFLDEKSIEI